MPKHSLNRRRRANRRGWHLRAFYDHRGKPWLRYHGWVSVCIQTPRTGIELLHPVRPITAARHV